MVAEKEPQEVQEVGDAIVDWRSGHQKDATPNGEPSEGAITIRLWIAKTMGFVDDEETVRDGRGR